MITTDALRNRHLNPTLNTPLLEQALQELPNEKPIHHFRSYPRLSH